MIKYLSLIVLLFSIFNIISCTSPDNPATGSEDEIYVIADSLEYQHLKPSLDSVFERVIYTPQPESLFTLKRISPNQLENYKLKKNLLIAAPLNSRSVTSQFINAIMDSASKEKAVKENNIYFNKYNLWAKNQLVMILTAPSITQLTSLISTNKDDILYPFQQISDKRLYECLYNPSYERKDVEGMLLKNYGWIIYIQANYKLIANDSKDNFISFKCTPGKDMQKWLFVHWIDSASPQNLNADSIRSIRNRLTKRYYKVNNSDVVIAKDFFTTHEVNFNGRYAILTQGLWDLNGKDMGGPFINYTFFDQNTKRTYMLDGSLFAPKYYKRNLIHQMDVILQSFMTSSELNKNRMKDLLDKAAEYKSVSEK